MRTIEFGTPGDSRDLILKFLLDGQKRATAGLKSEYLEEGEPIEYVGEKLGVLDNSDQLVAVIEVTRVETLRLIDVPDEFALAEAEGDLNAEDFRNSHYAYWSRTGKQITDETEVVCMYFDLIADLRSKN